MNFNQLITTNPNEITEGQRAFLDTHNAIMRSGRIMTESAVGLAANLKTMRDGKLYAEAGFDTFEDYTENAVGLKRRQAYNYIKVLETYGEEFVQLTAQSVGITKLELLTHLTEEQREQVEAKGAVSDISVSELKKRIKELEKETQGLKEDSEKAQEQIEELQAMHDQAVEELKQKEAELENVQSTAQNDNSAELEKQVAKLQKELKALQSKPAEKEIVEKIVKDDKSAAELAEAKKKLAAHDAAIKAKEEELLKVRKQLENAGDQNFIKFKVKFDELKALIGDVLQCLAALDADKQEKCKAALKAVVGGMAI